jgi:hypothetical protein
VHRACRAPSSPSLVSGSQALIAIEMGRVRAPCIPTNSEHVLSFF